MQKRHADDVGRYRHLQWLLCNFPITCSRLHHRTGPKASFIPLSLFLLFPALSCFFVLIIHLVAAAKFEPRVVHHPCPFWRKRMQRRASGYGEDSSQKNRDHNDLCVPPHRFDVEKTAVDPSGGPVASDHANENQSPSHQNGQGLFRERPTPDSDVSSLTDEKDDFPEGGLRGYSVVIGAFCGLFSVFGIINSTGILLEYFSTHQLKDYTSSQIGWYV